MVEYKLNDALFPNSRALYYYNHDDVEKGNGSHYPLMDATGTTIGSISKFGNQLNLSVIMKPLPTDKLSNPFYPQSMATYTITAAAGASNDILAGFCAGSNLGLNSYTIQKTPVSGIAQLELRPMV